MNIKAEVYEINQRMIRLESSNSLKDNILLKQLRIREFSMLEQYLISSDITFKCISDENRNLLKCDELLFKVYRAGEDYFKSYTKKMAGVISSNGYLYLEATEVETAFFGVQKGTYPKSFFGKMDSIGNTFLEVTKTGYRLIGSFVPKSFIGSISETGNVQMQIFEKDFELLGTIFMKKLICDPFKGNEDKKIKFMNNSEKIKERIMQIKVELLNN